MIGLSGVLLLSLSLIERLVPGGLLELLESSKRGSKVSPVVVVAVVSLPLSDGSEHAVDDGIGLYHGNCFVSGFLVGERVFLDYFDSYVSWQERYEFVEGFVISGRVSGSAG